MKEGESRPATADDPEWKLISAGINFEAKCQKPDCPTRGEWSFVRVGYTNKMENQELCLGEFIGSDDCKCTGCGEILYSTDVRGILFRYPCVYSWRGRKAERGSKNEVLSLQSACPITPFGAHFPCCRRALPPSSISHDNTTNSTQINTQSVIWSDGSF